MRILPSTILLALALGAGGCSTAAWYDIFQGAQYDKCDKLANAEDRRRCTATTRPDADQYARERAAAQSGSARP